MDDSDERLDAAIRKLMEKPAAAKKLQPCDWFGIALVVVVIALTPIYIAFGLGPILSVVASAVTAAWVQAIGSIGALAVAIWISTEGQRAERRAALNRARNFAHGVCSTLSAAVQAADDMELSDVAMLKDVLEDQLEWARSMDVGRLSGDHQLAAVGARTIAIHALHEQKDFLANASRIRSEAAPAFNSHRGQLEKLQKRAADFAELLTRSD